MFLTKVLNTSMMLGRVVFAHRTPKTIRVLVTKLNFNNIFLKYDMKKTTYMVHDEREETLEGDWVMIGPRVNPQKTRAQPWEKVFAKKPLKVCRIVYPVARDPNEITGSADHNPEWKQKLIRGEPEEKLSKRERKELIMGGPEAPRWKRMDRLTRIRRGYQVKEKNPAPPQIVVEEKDKD